MTTETVPTDIDEALEGFIKDAIVKGLNIHWTDAMDALSDALLLDLKERAEVDAHLCMRDDKNVKDGSELYISPFMGCTTIGEPIPLSDMLIDAVDSYGAQAVSQALETSLARFRADVQKEN